ncbi:MAG: hypothetical protein BJ554DRAFT_4004 [Olpidium bornovanus]|uniref:Uncharacterized protein n=1 Tax=Olpidium bornovanus TaxID=278681 RepID=A0A8H8DFU4_9FUNG|nr:MAG: hypothetical protein BJ554DRAFT_4004 [Olpidium bornovanus]
MPTPPPPAFSILDSGARVSILHPMVCGELGWKRRIQLYHRLQFLHPEFNIRMLTIRLARALPGPS